MSLLPPRCGRLPLLHMQQARSLGQGVSAGQRSRDACQRQQAPPASTVSLHRSVVTVGTTKSKAGVKAEVMLDLLKIQSKSTRPQWGLVQLLHCWRHNPFDAVDECAVSGFRKTSSVELPECVGQNCQNVWDRTLSHSGTVSGPVPNKARRNRGHLSLYS